ncbi:MAG: hypothetical protein H6728_10465 [Myxococcales bacterium]|nr:hypothetical protein [Myxococcales bacterium]MCB9643481.1 hypothetical protein [Myxococcales bacterium]
MSINRTGNTGPKPSVQQAQTPTRPAQPQQSQSTQAPRPFEPSQNILQQNAPSLGRGQAAGGIKAGLMPRNLSNQGLGRLLNNVRKSLDSFIRNLNWRTRTRPPQNTNPQKPPPIQAMYGVALPPGGGGIGGGSLPIQPMYGVTIPNPGVTPPPNNGGGSLPIQPMYGVTIPTPGGNTTPPIQAMYGVALPPGGETKPPVFQPMYGVTLPNPGQWSLFTKS